MSLAASLSDTAAKTSVHMETDTLRYRKDIDGLRAVAVLLVLLFHAFPDLLQGGFVGVDVFFVISGFLITGVILTSIESGKFTISHFYERRIRRIFPALILVLTACLAFGWITLLADDLLELSRHVVAGAAFFSNLLLWHESGYFDKVSATKPLLHLWSLGIEEQFYLVWPLVIWTAHRRRWPIIWIVVGLASASLALNLLLVHSRPVAAFYSPLSRAWELLLGAALAGARFCSRGPFTDGSSAKQQRLLITEAKILNRDAGAILGISLILGSAIVLKQSDPFPGWLALIPCIGSVLLLRAGPGAWFNRVVLGNRIAVAIGLISFPLYLWHWPLLVFARSVGGDELAIGIRIGMLVLSGLLAALTYLLVERPFRFGGAGRPKTLSLAAAGLVVGIVGSWIVHDKGAPSRYPEIVQRATQYDLEGYRFALRNRICFMDLDQNASQFKNECVDTGNKPLWMLWGDSGAATLYPGLRSLAEREQDFRIAQFTSSSCPPMLLFDSKINPACKGNNEKVMSIVREQKPDTVLLSAIWSAYDKTHLVETVKAIKDAGVRRIFILGPAPAWRKTPSQILFDNWKSDPLHRPPPARLDYALNGMGEGQTAGSGVDLRTSAAEDELKKVAETEGATYISLMSALCNRDGCLTRASVDSGDAFYLDVVHLNKTGSDYVIRKIAPELGFRE